MGREDFLPLPRAGEGRGEGIRVVQGFISRYPLTPALSPRGEGAKPCLIKRPEFHWIFTVSVSKPATVPTITSPATTAATPSGVPV